MDLYDHAWKELALLFNAESRVTKRSYNAFEQFQSQRMEAKSGASGQIETFYIERERTFRDEDEVFFVRYQAVLRQLGELEHEFAETARSLPATSAIAHQTVAAAGLHGDIAGEAARTFTAAFTLLVDLANSTYEGQRLGLNIALDFDVALTRATAETSRMTLDEYGAERWHRLLGTNASTAIVICAQGTVNAYLDASNAPTAASAGAYPNVYSRLGRWVDASLNATRSVLALTPSGEILLLHGGRVRFIYRNGSWRSLVLRDFLPVDGTIGLLGVDPELSIGKQLEIVVVSTAIDASLAHQGATIAIVDAKRFIAGEVINPGSSWKRSKIRPLLPSGRTFLEMSPQHRLELLSIDGATIIDEKTGEVLATGAIVTKVEAGSTGGGRTAATRTLACYGTALKVSQDGAIEVWQGKRDGSRAKRTAVVG